MPLPIVRAAFSEILKFTVPPLFHVQEPPARIFFNAVCFRKISGIEGVFGDVYIGNRPRLDVYGGSVSVCQGGIVRKHHIGRIAYGAGVARIESPVSVVGAF